MRIERTWSLWTEQSFVCFALISLQILGHRSVGMMRHVSMNAEPWLPAVSIGGTETVYLSLCGDNEHIVLWMGTWQSDKGVVGGVVSDRHRAYTF